MAEKVNSREQMEYHAQRRQELQAYHRIIAEAAEHQLLYEVYE